MDGVGLEWMVWVKSGWCGFRVDGVGLEWMV